MNAATRPTHTPGPYVRDGLFILTQRIENTTGIGELVAKLPEFEARKFVGESEADYKARFRRFSATGDLLASAPDLLAELERTEASLTAILCSRVIDSTTSTWLELRRNRDAIRAAIAKARG